MSYITYLFPNFNGAAVEVREWINDFIPHFTGFLITYQPKQTFCKYVCCLLLQIQLFSHCSSPAVQGPGLVKKSTINPRCEHAYSLTWMFNMGIFWQSRSLLK